MIPLVERKKVLKKILVFLEYFPVLYHYKVVLTLQVFSWIVQAVQAVIKHPHFVMVWSAICSDDSGDLCIL